MKYFKPKSTSHNAMNICHDLSWDRRFLAPFAHQRFNFTGVIIDKIPYPNNRVQVIIASIYDISGHDFDIDHVSVRFSKRQADTFSLFTPIKFSAVVHPYPTTEHIYLEDIRRFVPAQLTNYTLDEPRSVLTTATAQLKRHRLSLYCINRLKMIDTQMEDDAKEVEAELLAMPNDGRREALLDKYVTALQRPVNRISLHKKLK